jgi:hypothetical protein
MMSRIQLVVYLLVIAALIGLGVYMKKGYDAIQEVKALKEQRTKELDHAAKTDTVVAEKISTESKAARDMARVEHQREEMRHANPDYDDYLARPLPAESRRLYEHADQVRYGAPQEHPSTDGTERGAE